MSSNNIMVSPKYGLNPTIPVCFWCGEERQEIALMGRIGNVRKGEDFEAPVRAVIDFEPCEKCAENMLRGFTLMEATTRPNEYCPVEMQSGVYPTGRYIVVKPDVVSQMFGDISAKQGGKAFVDEKVFTAMIQGLKED